MEKVTLGNAPPDGASVEQKLAWCIDALVRIQRASGQRDPGVMASNFKSTGTLTPTRLLDLTTPTLANISQVLGTFIQDFSVGGAKR